MGLVSKGQGRACRVFRGYCALLLVYVYVYVCVCVLGGGGGGGSQVFGEEAGVVYLTSSIACLSGVPGAVCPPPPGGGDVK